METAAGDCWVTVTGNVTVSTQHLQCKTCRTKTFNQRRCWNTLLSHLFACWIPTTSCASLLTLTFLLKILLQLKNAGWLAKDACRSESLFISSCSEHGPQRLLTILCGDWSLQITLSIAGAAVNWRPLLKVIWMELWERNRHQREIRTKTQQNYTRKRRETIWRTFTSNNFPEPQKAWCRKAHKSRSTIFIVSTTHGKSHVIISLGNDQWSWKISQHMFYRYSFFTIQKKLRIIFQ